MAGARAYRRWAGLFALFAAAVITPPPAMAAPPAPALRVTLIGVDGAAWRVLDPLLARDATPNFARLVAAGVRAPLRSRIPLWSPAVWTTIATGVRRERHAIINFLTPDGGLVASADRRAPTLWTMASATGIRTAVIGWWVTYPAESIDGVIVSERALKTRDTDLRAMATGRAAPAAAAGFVSPPAAIDAVADVLATLPDAAPGDDQRARVVARMRLEDQAVVSLLARLRERLGPFGLEMILLRGTDPVSHHFWRYYEPNAAAYRAAAPLARAELDRHRATIEDYYRYVDGLLSTVAAEPSPHHVVMILSDHGFEAGLEDELTGTHLSARALYGVFIVAGGPFRRAVTLERVTTLDVAPTVLHLLDVPIPSTLEGRVLTDAMDPAWIAAHPVRPGGAPPGPVVALPAEAFRASTDSPADPAVREQLRALGYIHE